MDEGPTAEEPLAAGAVGAWFLPIPCLRRSASARHTLEHEPRFQRQEYHDAEEDARPGQEILGLGKARASFFQI